MLHLPIEVMRELIDRVLSAIMTAIGGKHGSCVRNGGNHVHDNCHRTRDSRSGGVRFGPSSGSRDGSRISRHPMADGAMRRPLSHGKPAMVFFPACYVYMIWWANGSVDHRRRGARADDATTSHTVLDGTIHDTGAKAGSSAVRHRAPDTRAEGRHTRCQPGEKRWRRSLGSLSRKFRKRD